MCIKNSHLMCTSQIAIQRHLDMLRESANEDFFMEQNQTLDPAPGMAYSCKSMKRRPASWEEVLLKKSWHIIR